MVGVKFLASNERTKHAWHNEFGWRPAKVYGLSFKILFKQKWGIPKVYSFRPFLAGPNLVFESGSAQNIAKS